MSCPPGKLRGMATLEDASVLRNMPIPTRAEVLGKLYRSQVERQAKQYRADRQAVANEVLRRLIEVLIELGEHRAASIAWEFHWAFPRVKADGLERPDYLTMVRERMAAKEAEQG